VIVVRFRLQCQPDRTEEVEAAMNDVVGPSRQLPGVMHFDVARSTTDADTLIAVEVFEDRAAMEAQESQPEVAKVVGLMEAGALAAAPEWTIYEVASAENPGG
jgi:quinol monooxygenase YgiN